MYLLIIDLSFGWFDLYKVHIKVKLHKIIITAKTAETL